MAGSKVGLVNRRNTNQRVILKPLLDRVPSAELARRVVK